MSSSTLGALRDFLAGASGDVRASVNAELPNALDEAAVVFARDHRGRQQRRSKAPALNIEIVPRPASPPRPIGIGWVERDVALDMKATLRGKATAAGEEQLDQVEAVAAILERRYHGRTRLDLPSTASFRHSVAEVTDVDEVPESSEIARSVVRVTFTFTESLDKR